MSMQQFPDLAPMLDSYLRSTRQLGRLTTGLDWPPYFWWSLILDHIYPSPDDALLAAEPPQALAELSLADNRLASLPAALSGASSLARLHLFGNGLRRLPVGQLASLPSLSDLWLEGNPGLDAGDLGRLVEAAGAGGMPRLKALGMDQQQVGCAVPCRKR